MVLGTTRIGIVASDSIQGLTVRDGRTQNLAKGGAVKPLSRRPAAYFIDYVDGTHATLLMLDGASRRLQLRRPRPRRQRPVFVPVSVAAEPQCCLLGLFDAPCRDHDRVGPGPLPRRARPFLVSGILESCLDSKLQAHRRLDTPHSAVRYQPPRDSCFCRS